MKLIDKFSIACLCISPLLEAAVLEEVMVTATRRSENANDVGIAITAFSGDQIEQMNFTYATQIAAMAPGVQALAPNGESTHGIGIRGVANSDFITNVESPVALYVDDIYISQQAGSGFQLYDLERVEILRGPQGTLFGRNATGGLAHYITRKPTSDAEGYIRSAVGSYDQRRLEGAISGGSDKLSARLSGTYHRNGGYVTNRFIQADGSGSPDLNNANDKSARLHVLWSPTEDIDLLITGRTFDQDIRSGFFEYVSSVVQGQLTPGVSNPVLNGYVDNDGDVYAGEYDDPGFSEVSAHGISANLQWSLGETVLTSVTDFSTLDRGKSEDADSSPVPFYTAFQTTEADQFSQEIRLAGTAERFEWLIGGYYLNLDADDVYGAVTDPFLGPAPTPGAEGGLWNGYTSELESLSVFGQVDVPLREDLTLSLGARYIIDEKSFDYRSLLVEYTEPDARDLELGVNANSLAVFATYEGAQEWKDWAGRANLEWRPDENWLYYIGWNRGIRAGGFNAPVFPLTPPLGYDDETMVFDPEVLDAFEFGFKGEILNGAARLNGAVYYYDYAEYQGYQIQEFDVLTFNTDATSYGGELELQASPISGMQILLGAAYNDIAVEVGELELPTIQAPEWNLNALVRYEWPFAGGNLAIQGDIVYRSEIFFALVEPNETIRQEGYSVSNASLTYFTDDRRWEAMLFVQNLTDEEYLLQTFDLSGPNVFGMTEQWYGRPRWWGLSLTYRWGD